MVKLTANPERRVPNSAPVTPAEVSRIPTPNGLPDGKVKNEESSKRRRRRKARKRRNSIGKAARDPRDAVSPPEELESETRSPSPGIDFEGLSKPSKLRRSTYFSPVDCH